MFDFENHSIQNHGRELKARNETVVKDIDCSDIFRNNSLDDVFVDIEKELLSDDSFPALSNLPSASLPPLSSSALHWSYQPDQFCESNMHPNLDAMLLRPNSQVQEPDRFDDLDLRVPETGFDDFFQLPDEWVVNYKDLDITKIDQSTKLVEGNGNGGGTYTDSSLDPDLAKMFLDWLRFNRDAVSLEDLRAIKLKNSTVENAFARLGNDKEGKKKLLQLVLTWVQQHKLRKKKHLQIGIPNCPNPYSKEYQFPNMCVNSQSVANPNIDPNWNMQYTPPFSVNSDLPNANTPMQENAGMAGSSSATEEARKRRLERKRRLSALYSHKTKDNTMDILKPVSEIGNRFCKFANKLHDLKFDCQNILQSPDPANMAPNTVNVQDSMATFMEKRKARSMDLKFLFQKTLKQSDVGSLGRIVLPKKEAEKHLPMLEERGRIRMQMEDINLFRTWDLWYRFWPNNKSRMYVLENTGEFVRSNELQEGDIVVVYLNIKNGLFMIKGNKMKQPGAHKEVVETCKDRILGKEYWKTNSDLNASEKLDESMTEGDNCLVEIPSDSKDD